MTFEEHFSGHANAYVQHRPRYPEALFTWLASVIRGTDLAWDAGTGNGQVAVALTGHLDRGGAFRRMGRRRAAAHDPLPAVPSRRPRKSPLSPQRGERAG